MSNGPVSSGHSCSWATVSVAKTSTFCRYHHSHRSSHHNCVEYLGDDVHLVFHNHVQADRRARGHRVRHGPDRTRCVRRSSPDHRARAGSVAADDALARAGSRSVAAARFRVLGRPVKPYSWRIGSAYSRSRGPDDNRGFQGGFHLLSVWN